MAGAWRTLRFFHGGLLLLALPVAAQIRLGEISADADGTISSGYTASYGNMTPSNHGLTLGGATNLSGSFYNPNFLSFNASLYLNQSRANSNFRIHLRCQRGQPFHQHLRRQQIPRFD